MHDHPELTQEMRREMEKIASEAEGWDRSLAPPVINTPVDKFRDAYTLIMERKVIGKSCVVWQPEEKAKL